LFGSIAKPRLQVAAASLFCQTDGLRLRQFQKQLDVFRIGSERFFGFGYNRLVIGL
jgi:hypothetical protein